MRKVSNIDRFEAVGGAILSRMPCYSFSIQTGDGRDREYVGRIDLSDDDEARAFGAAILWDMRDAKQYAGWIMSIATGERTACLMPFDAATPGQGRPARVVRR